MIEKIGKRTLYVSDRPVEGGTDSVKPKADTAVQQCPDTETERSVLYITGQSGSGKSFYTRNYISEFRKSYPKREVYVFSSLDDDPTLDRLKFLKRIKVRKPEFLSAEISTEDFANSLVIFDDTDCIADKKIKIKVYSILTSILQTGRHFNISVIYTSHNAACGNETKTILNECTSLTVFPRNLGGKTSKYVLESYLGLSSAEIKRLRAADSRWATIVKCYPQVVLTEHEAFQ